MFWPVEESVSVVCGDDVVSPQLSALDIGATCDVKVGKKLWKGKVAAIGKCIP